MDRRHFIKISAGAVAALATQPLDLSSLDEAKPRKIREVDLETDFYTVMFGGYHVPDPTIFRIGDIWIDRDTQNIWQVQEVTFKMGEKKFFKDTRFVLLHPRWETREPLKASDLKPLNSHDFGKGPC